MKRLSRHVVLVVLALLAACALPPNTALRDWARLGSVLVDRPDALAGSEGLVAQQQALAIYLYALSVLAQEESQLTFRAASYAPLGPRATASDPAAGAAVVQLGRLLAAAQAANLAPGARARSAGSQTVIEDLRLRPLIRDADAPVRMLAASLARGAGDPAYRDLLTAIAEGHALLQSQAGTIGQRATARDIHDQEDRLRRIMLILEPDATVGLRPDPAGAVGAVVQP